MYGQVFKSGSNGLPGTFLEIHYYHLWSRDCGPIAHALDVEYVSVLVQAASLQESPRNWKAVYWYAAAHEGTVCDISHGAKAAVLGAIEHGPDVWISSGKHASFLDPSLCGRGCGADRCGSANLPHANKLINIGEPGAPMNGAKVDRIGPLATVGEDEDGLRPRGDRAPGCRGHSHGLIEGRPVFRTGHHLSRKFDVWCRREWQSERGGSAIGCQRVYRSGPKCEPREGWNVTATHPASGRKVVASRKPVSAILRLRPGGALTRDDSRPRGTHIRPVGEASKDRDDGRSARSRCLSSNPANL